MKKFLILFLLSIPLGITHASFRDIDVTHPYFHAIIDFQEKEIVEGYPNKNHEYFFRPVQKLNRAEALKIIWTARFGRDGLRENLQQNFHTTLFPDVPKGVWFTPTINAAAKKKIVTGFPDGKFHPESQVTRAEFLSMVTKAYGIPNTFLSADQKNKKQDWFTPFMEKARSFVLLPSHEIPHEALTRAEAVEILYRANSIYEKKFRKKYQIYGKGWASYYHNSLKGNPTANGEIYDPEALTAAHRSFPFNTKLKVFRPETPDKFVVVRINDRGPYHKERILDLSRSAFEILADKGAGVIEVDFEVITPDESTGMRIIPEDIEKLSAQSSGEYTSDRRMGNPDIEIVRNKSNSKKQKKAEKVAADKKILAAGKTLKKKPKSLQKHAKNFYEGILLKDSFPQEVELGDVILFSGTTIDLEAKNGDYVTFFIEKYKEPYSSVKSAQYRYKTKLSGRNFTIGVPFLEKGTYILGVILDNTKYSKMAKIEVLNRNQTVYTPLLKTEYTSWDRSGNFRIKGEEEMIKIYWDRGVDVRSKFIFSQGDKKIEIHADPLLSRVEIPSYFFQKFSPKKNLKVEFYQAIIDRDSRKQIRAYIPINHKSYELALVFPHGQNELIFKNFPEFIHKHGVQAITGKTQNSTVKLGQTVYITKPDGFVDTTLLSQSGINFSFEYDFNQWGIYLVEVLDPNANIVFNNPIYVSKNFTLALFEWPKTLYHTETEDPVVATLNWVNKLRGVYGLSELGFSGKLNDFAYEYAQTMVENEFIGHVSPEGITFADRITTAKITGISGENLALATTVDLALFSLENSGSHRKNLLNPDWKSAGISVVKHPSKDLYYMVQIFSDQ